MDNCGGAAAGTNELESKIGLTIALLEWFCQSLLHIMFVLSLLLSLMLSLMLWLMLAAHLNT
jgi:hypothetical protein